MAREVGARLAGRSRTLDLIGPVPAVIITVTDPPLLDTLPVATSELIRTASLIACFLIRSVGTVGVVVTHPGQRDALARLSPARELLRAATLHFASAGLLVGAIGAVLLVVAAPRGRDTAPGLAPELGGSTRAAFFFAFFNVLVGVVTTIVVSLAHPRQRYALPVRTRELLYRAHIP